MKKWLVRIQFTDGVDNIHIIYAKNKNELRSFVNKWVSDMLERIDGYGYDELSRKKIRSYRWQKKNEWVPYSFYDGNWVGANFIERWLADEYTRNKRIIE